MTTAQPTSTAVATVTERGVALTTYADALTFAQAVCQAGLQPSSMKSPQQVAVAMLAGKEMGMAAMESLQALCVINGKVSQYGDYPLSRCRRSGQVQVFAEWYEDDTGRIENTAAGRKRLYASLASGSLVAVCRTQRKGEDSYEDSYGVEDAKKANLLTKAGPWQTDPLRMLRMRARSRVLRAVYSDVMGGLPVAEELEGIREADFEDKGNAAPRSLSDLTAQATPAQEPAKSAEPARSDTKPAGEAAPQFESEGGQETDLPAGASVDDFSGPENFQRDGFTFWRGDVALPAMTWGESERGEVYVTFPRACWTLGVPSAWLHTKPWDKPGAKTVLAKFTPSEILSDAPQGGGRHGALVAARKWAHEKLLAENKPVPPQFQMAELVLALLERKWAIERMEGEA